jgi:2-dehydropantoate 2-reductase
MIKIDLIGLGAIGAAYGAVAKSHGGSEIRVLVNDSRYASYVSKTMEVNGVPFVFNAASPGHREKAFSGPADVMIIACKYPVLEAALDVAEAFIGDDTLVLTVLNGLLSEEAAIKRFGAQRVLHSFCMGIDTVKSGDKVDYKNIGRIVFGAIPQGTQDSRVQRVKKIFEAAGIPYEVPDDILAMLWKKFMINVAGNQLSAVLELNYSYFQEDEDLKVLLGEVMGEVVRLAHLKGVNLSEDAIAEYLEAVKTHDPKGKTSMHQDIEAGRPTEVELFAGHMLKMGEEEGIELPYNRMLYHLIKIKERQNGVRGV